METKPSLKFYKINHETEQWEESIERTCWNASTIDPEIPPKFRYFHTESDGVLRKQFAITPSKKLQEFLSKSY